MMIETNNPLRSTAALAALSTVTDPEIGLNIVDLGLVYRLDFDAATNTVRCDMSLTTQFCPMGSAITEAARNALAGAFPESDIDLRLTFNPPWSAERISPEGREFLNR